MENQTCRAIVANFAPLTLETKSIKNITQMPVAGGAAGMQ